MMNDMSRPVPRLSGTERLILDLLRQGELFGLQLVDRSEGALKRGTVYVTLGRMQDKGYVESRTEPLPPGRHRPAAPLVPADRVRAEGQQRVDDGGAFVRGAGTADRRGVERERQTEDRSTFAFYVLFGL